MKRGRWLVPVAVAFWTSLVGAHGSEYIRGLGATGDPRAIARIVTDLDIHWPDEMGRYCTNYRDLLEGMLTSVHHKSNLQVVEATVNPLLAKREVAASEYSEEFVMIQGMAIQLLLATAELPGTPTPDRLRIADRCLDWMGKQQKLIHPEYDRMGFRIALTYSVSIGGSDTVDQEERIKLEEEKRIAYLDSLLIRRQEALRDQIRLDSWALVNFLRMMGRENPELVKVVAAKAEQAESLAEAAKEVPASP